MQQSSYSMSTEYVGAKTPMLKDKDEFLLLFLQWLRNGCLCILSGRPTQVTRHLKWAGPWKSNSLPKRSGRVRKISEVLRDPKESSKYLENENKNKDSL